MLGCFHLTAATGTLSRHRTNKNTCLFLSQAGKHPARCNMYEEKPATGDATTEELERVGGGRVTLSVLQCHG